MLDLKKFGARGTHCLNYARHMPLADEVEEESIGYSYCRPRCRLSGRRPTLFVPAERQPLEHLNGQSSGEQSTV